MTPKQTKQYSDLYDAIDALTQDADPEIAIAAVGGVSAKLIDRASQKTGHAQNRLLKDHSDLIAFTMMMADSVTSKKQ